LGLWTLNARVAPAFLLSGTVDDRQVGRAAAMAGE